MPTARRGGFAAVVAKPFDLDTLLDVVARSSTLRARTDLNNAVLVTTVDKRAEQWDRHPRALITMCRQSISISYTIGTLASL